MLRTASATNCTMNFLRRSTPLISNKSKYEMEFALLLGQHYTC